MPLLVFDKKKTAGRLRLLWLLASFFILEYGFIKLPIPNLLVAQAVWFLLSLIYFLSRYGGHLLREIFRSRYTRYIAFLMLFPFFYAVIAHRELGQNLISGIVSGRSFFFLFPLLVMSFYIRTGRLSVNDIFHGIKNMAWFCLALYIFLISFADLTAGDLKVYGSSGVRGERLRFDATYIAFGFFYYYVLVVTSQRSFMNFFCALSFCYF